MLGLQQELGAVGEDQHNQDLEEEEAVEGEPVMQEAQEEQEGQEEQEPQVRRKLLIV